MVWTSQSKALEISKATPHPSSVSGVAGCALGVKEITFTPLELFGSTARCSHLHFVNPALVTPESHLIAALVEQYVDNVSRDFAVLPAADRFKDFARSYFVGTVASGLAYLAMTQDGYHWSDHFENVAGSKPAGRSPDYVFTGNGAGTALVEAKGTRSAHFNPFDGTVRDGYLCQVEPHLGHTFNGVRATHGYAIGAWLTSTTKAEMLVHHTAANAASAPGGASQAAHLTVQQHNYATVANLVHGAGLAAQIRQGRIDSAPRFVRFFWLERSWLMGLRWIRPWSEDEDFYWDIRWRLSRKPRMRRPEGWPPFIGFAIEETIATAVLSRVFGSEGPEDTPLGIDPLPRDLRERARQEYSGRAGAVFPDGLAVLGWGNRFEEPRPVRWNRQERAFTFEP